MSDMVKDMNQSLSTEDMEKYGEKFIMNKRKIEDCAKNIREERRTEDKKAKLKDTVWKDWQSEAL